MLNYINRGMDGEFSRPPLPPLPTKFDVLGQFIKTLVLLPFKIAFSPLYFAYWLLSGGLVTNARRHDSPLTPLAAMLTAALWSSPLWGVPLGYKLVRNQEIVEEVKTRPLKGTLIYTKNKTLSVATATDLLNKSESPSVIITHNDIEDIAYIGDQKIGYIYQRSLWVLDLKTGVNRQILATKGNLDDRFITRIEADNGKICIKISSDRWFSITPDGKSITEISVLSSFKPKNISPDGRFIIDRGNLVWNQEKWGSINLGLDGSRVVWIPEEMGGK